MPHKHNAARRHHISKMNFNVTNWAEYDAGPRQRGRLTVWVGNNTKSGESIYTFWAYFRNAFALDVGLRIDHFLLSPDLAEKLTKAEVDKHVRGWDHTSDHAPVWSELSDKPIKLRESK